MTANEKYERNYFVMLEHPRGWPVPMIDSESAYDDLAWFETEDDARRCARQNPLGEAYGFEVFERGGGV